VRVTVDSVAAGDGPPLRKARCMASEVWKAGLKNLGVALKTALAWPPMATALHSRLSALADNFANTVLDAIRGAPLEELLGGGSGRSSPVRRAKANPKPARASSSGRLKRRSPEDIASALEHVHGLLKRHKDGLRAEQIRDTLRMQSKEMPRVLAEGLAKRKLKKKGQKRATTYFAV
jgi:hypothetical protein